MVKNSITALTLLLSLAVFGSPAFAEMGGKEPGKVCDKIGTKECDMLKKKDCDHKRDDCDTWRYKKGDHRHGKGGFDILKIAEEIGLSGKQVKQIKGIKSGHEKKMIMLKAEIDVLELELSDLHRDYSTDAAAYGKKVRELFAKMGDKKIAYFQMKKEISGVMTEKQRDKIRDYFKKKYKKK